jgi:plasmid stabilization system protein ParE
MELKVVWTKRAKKNYIKILEYIGNEFGSSPGKKYNKRVGELITLLRPFPELGTKQTGYNNLRGIILYRRTTIFYIIDNQVITIINIIDNRWKK